MKVLLVDLESSPNVADVWRLFDNTVSLAQLRESTRVIGFGAKFLGEKSVKFYAEYDFSTRKRDNHRAMIERAWELYDEADVTVTYNGDKYDHLHFSREWVQAGMTPPSPSKSVDLYKTVRSRFKFPSNKLAYVAQTLLDDTKVSHSGHSLWRQCLDADVAPEVRHKAWRTMARYCKQDVALLEPLYLKLRPWIHNHPSVALDHGIDGCNRCGSQNLQKRGYDTTSLGKFQRLQCQDCGGWLRAGKRLDSVDLRGIK